MGVRETKIEIGTRQDGRTAHCCVSNITLWYPCFTTALYTNKHSIIVCAVQAKLPRGIENIRPHIENVDNVPLLVSLFTDCTPEATLEMVRIMQEYGEVVCCLGSAASLHNLPVFLQADCR